MTKKSLPQKTLNSMRENISCLFSAWEFSICVWVQISWGNVSRHYVCSHPCMLHQHLCGAVESCLSVFAWETVNPCSGFTGYSGAKVDSGLLICLSLGCYLNMVLCPVSYSIFFSPVCIFPPDFYDPELLK